MTRVTRLRRANGPVTLSITFEGVCRIAVKSVDNRSRRTAHITPLEDQQVTEAEASEEARELRKLVALALGGVLASAPFPSRAAHVMQVIPAAMLCDIVLAALSLSFEDKLKALGAVDVTERCQLTLQLLSRAVQSSAVPELMDSIKTLDENTPKEIVPRGRRQAMRRKSSAGDEFDELFDGAQDEAASEVLKHRLKAANLPMDVKHVAAAELKKLEQMEQSHNLGPEHQKGAAYLDWLASLPWSISSLDPPKIDLKAVRDMLDADHFG